MAKKMLVEIWSDIACPYCYIGKKKFEKALEQFPNRDKVMLEWHSYELNPALPKAPLDKPYYEYYAESHRCSLDKAKADALKLQNFAAETGLRFNLEKLVVTSTSDAIRLMKLARMHGMISKVSEALFKAYFTDGECVSDRRVLLRIGKEAGLDEDEITKMLDSRKYLSEMEKDIEYSENGLNLEYIPFFLFNNSHVVQGSVSVDEYLQVLEKSFSEWEKSGVASGKGDVVSGKSCSADGVCSL